MLSLRSATEADIPVIHALAHRIWWAHYPAIIGEKQVAYMLELNYDPANLARQLREEQTFWLLENAGEIAGFIAVSDQGEGRYFIHKFYLDNNQRGRGLGAGAFQLILEKYPELLEIRLTVNRQNFKSVNFYFKIGFFIEKCIDIPIGEGFVMNDFQMLWLKRK